LHLQADDGGIEACRPKRSLVTKPPSPGKSETSATVVVRGLTEPARLDKVLRAAYPQAGRQTVQALITGGQVKVNGRAVWLCSWLVANGDQLELSAEPQAKPQAFTTFDDTWIISEASDLIVVDKPAGLLSEPTRWTDAPSLLSLANRRFGSLTLFHRLDRDTSGLVVLTRTAEMNRLLDAAFKAGTVVKEYLAVVAQPNRLAQQGVISVPLGPHPRRHDMMTAVERGGQRAVTRYEVIAQAGGRQWVRLWPRTGRTHQIRVHLAYLGAPILGDRLYWGEQKKATRLMLHALRITLPEGASFPTRTFTAPWPADFPAPPDGWPSELGANAASG
jgi:23S rRNA pseudouridine1911/1915/1917 synthase